ncbi:hypothetical protein [Sedimenticola hydrogenitrophicus]|nr:hypothetical protein [Sedimenticola hydrogenitrophicus]
MTKIHSSTPFLSARRRSAASCRCASFSNEIVMDEVDVPEKALLPGAK